VNRDRLARRAKECWRMWWKRRLWRKWQMWWNFAKFVNKIIWV